MKAEDLFDAIGMAEDEMVQKAQTIKKKFWKKKRFYGAIAAVLAVCLLFGTVFGRSGGVRDLKAYAMAEAEYPQKVRMPLEEDYAGNWEAYNDDYDKWYREKREQLAYYKKDLELNSFLTKSIKEFLSGKDGENIAYSPINVYMALGMLAEITDGKSRAQILDLLGAADIKALRNDVSSLWNSHYCNDGYNATILANSLWLNESLDFKKSTLETLAETYYASSYKGEMGSDNFNQALQTWLNEQTGGLLEENIAQIEMSPETILALASTVYFKAKWSDTFVKSKTSEETFYAPDGEILCDFMKESKSGTFYTGDNFSAVHKYFESRNGGMWFILPEEGVTPEALLSDSQTMDFILSGSEWENNTYLRINLSVPKFDITSGLDLTDGLKKLGVTDVFDETASDFSSITKESPCILTKAQHDVRVMIDEEGCTAAAYTVLLNKVTGMPPKEEVDFVLNRPFLFVITSEVGLPLFVGIVNHPV